ncbi:MAG: iron-sulfur cluster assembly scaffold protein [Chitinispirillaceae bacterium]|jgi:nitrogen fixation NifU-like protein|nr:iron-sulfur cluster assembly scaffold protein [Chitinispirillaceae bacterium]
MNTNSAEPANMRRMNDPDGSAFIKGLCGDTMEMYLIIADDTITDAWFFTDGCTASRACGSMAAALAQGKTIMETLRLSPAEVIDSCTNLLADDIHCAILAVNTLHKAAADFLLRRRDG